MPYDNVSSSYARAERVTNIPLIMELIRHEELEIPEINFRELLRDVLDSHVRLREQPHGSSFPPEVIVRVCHNALYDGSDYRCLTSSRRSLNETNAVLRFIGEDTVDR